MKEPVLPDFPPPPPGAPLHSHASDAPGSSHDSLDLPDPPLPPLPNKANPFLQKGIGGVPQEHPDEADIPLPPPPAEAIHKAQSADPAKSIPQESALPDLPPPPLPEIPCPEEETAKPSSKRIKPANDSLPPPPTVCVPAASSAGPVPSPLQKQTVPDLPPCPDSESSAPEGKFPNPFGQQGGSRTAARFIRLPIASSAGLAPQAFFFPDKGDNSRYFPDHSWRRHMVSGRFPRNRIRSECCCSGYTSLRNSPATCRAICKPATVS